MNPIIKQFATKSNLAFETNDNELFCNSVEDVDISTEIQQFAELIIKECARVQHVRFCEHGDVSWDILMEHFGIE